MAKKKQEEAQKPAAVQPDDTQETAPLITGEDKPVSTDKLQKYWFEFAALIKEEGRDTLFSILNQEVELQPDGYTIKMSVTNPVLMDKVEEVRPRLIRFLKEKLQNSQLMLNPMLEQAKANSFAYTDEEKFRKLAEKYPYLLELKNRLGLDFA